MNALTKNHLHYLIITMLVFSIILTGYYYIDDIGRANLGYTLWSTNGRPVTEWLFILISQGYPIIDISPMTQIASIFLLGFSATKICEKIPIENAFYKSIIGASFALNPFMIEVLSYRYDSLSMSLSILFASLAVSIGWNNTCSKKNILLSVTFILLTMCTYQPSIGIYISFCVFEVLCKNFKRNYSILETIVRICCLVVAQLIYMFLITPIFVTGEYNTTHGTLTFNPHDIIQNIKLYYDLFATSYGGAFYYTYIFMLFANIALSIKSLIALKKNTSTNIPTKIFSIIIAITFPVLIFTSPFLPLVFLQNPVIAPRVFISFGATLFISIYSIYHTFKKLGYISLSILLLSTVSLYFSYSNALKSQGKLEDFYAMKIANIIEEQNLQVNTLAIDGYMKYSNMVLLYGSRFPIIEKTISTAFKKNWMFSAIYLKTYGVNVSFISNQDSNQAITKHCSLTPLVSNGDFSAYRIDNVILISFNKC